MEARAAGLPTVATDVGGVADVLDGYPLGILLPADETQVEPALDNALTKILDGTWPPPGTEPGPLPDRFSSEAIVDAVIELYEQVIEAKARTNR